MNHDLVAADLFLCIGNKNPLDLVLALSSESGQQCVVLSQRFRVHLVRKPAVSLKAMV